MRTEKAQRELIGDALDVLAGYQQLVREMHELEHAKLLNKGMLPLELWPRWQELKDRLKVVDQQAERIYR